MKEHNDQNAGRSWEYSVEVLIRFYKVAYSGPRAYLPGLTPWSRRLGRHFRPKSNTYPLDVLLTMFTES